MTKRIPIKKKKNIDLSKYVNIDTGEFLTDKINDKNSVIIDEKTDMSIVSYSDYSVISTEAILTLNQILNNSDLANVIKMAIVVKTPLSIVFNNNIPHTNDTLQKYLEIKSQSMFIGLIKRLMKAGVLYQMKGLVYGEVRVIYIINPYICRKRKTFENKILDIFKQFKEEIHNPIDSNV